MTRFVTWDLQERGGGALRRALPDQQDIVSVYQVAVEASKKSQPKQVEDSKGRKSGVVSTRDDSSSALSPIEDIEDNRERDYANLVQLTLYGQHMQNRSASHCGAMQSIRLLA